MKFNIKATNIALTPDISEYVNEKIGSLDRIIDPNDTSVSCHVEIGKTTRHHKSGDIYRAEVNFYKDGKQFRAVSEQESITAAIDEAKDEILREVKSYKSKKLTMVRRGGAAIKYLIKGIGGGVGMGVSAVGKIGKIRPWRKRRRD